MQNITIKDTTLEFIQDYLLDVYNDLDSDNHQLKTEIREVLEDLGLSFDV